MNKVIYTRRVSMPTPPGGEAKNNYDYEILSVELEADAKKALTTTPQGVEE